MPLSNNENYLIQITLQNDGNNIYNIKANAPENFMIAAGSQWESRFANAASIKNLIQSTPGIIGTAAGAAMFATNLDPIVQSLTFQTWQSSAPLEFNMTLQFDAYKSAVDDVLIPTAQLQASSLPFAIEASNDILLPPGPSPAYPNRARCSIRMGRWLYIHSILIKSVNNVYDMRLDKDGNPIAGQSEITFSTVNTPSRQDVTTFYLNLPGVNRDGNTAYGTRSGIIPGLSR